MLRRVTRTPRPFPFLSLLGPLLRPSSGLLAASLALAACGAAPPAREPARLGLSAALGTAHATRCQWFGHGAANRQARIEG